MATNGCRPDIAYVTKELSRNLSNPSHAHMKAAKRAVQYLYTTRYHGVTYDRRMNRVPQAYADADFANQLSNRRSTSGCVIMWHGAAIMWSSRQQRTVALSTAEAEINALTDLGRDIVWFRRLLADIGQPLTDPTPALEDSRSAIKWSEESASWSKTRHIDTAFHKLREWQEHRVLRIEYCNTAAQIADALTKALPTETHRRLTSKLLGMELTAHHSDFTYRRAAPAV